MDDDSFFVPRDEAEAATRKLALGRIDALKKVRHHIELARKRMLYALDVERTSEAITAGQEARHAAWLLMKWADEVDPGGKTPHTEKETRRIGRLLKGKRDE